MATSDTPRNLPLAEPGKRQSGSDAGGMPAAADARAAAKTPPAARPGGGAGKPGWEDDDEPWRHAPVAPKDENPLKSFGRSISETVTGPNEDQTGKPKA
jgi:hypothetical protein